MIARWCISVLIFSLTLFGVVSQQQITVANQEIVLQFQDADLTSNQTEKTVATIKQQLQDLGAKNIKVLSQGNHKLKITYYSDADISSIKETLSKESSWALQLTAQDKETSHFPFEDHNISFNLDVYEIQQNNSSGWDLDGAIVVQLDPQSDRFLDPNYFSVGSLEYQHEENLIQVAYRIRRIITIQISEPLHTTPEVRAGPNC